MRFTMKMKFLMSVAAFGLFAACSDDSSSSSAPVGPETPGPGVEAPADSIAPVPGNPEEDPGTSVDPLPDEPAETPDPVEPGDSPDPTPDEPVVTPDPVSYTYYGAELSGRDQFKYGRFEARMKMASIPGSISSMFLYYDDSYIKGEEPWNEIDIEVLGKSSTSWQSNIITREGTPSIKGTTTTEKIHEFGFDATEDFHLYAMVWTPEYVSWEIDSVEVRRVEIGAVNGTHADADQVAFLTKEQSLRFNLWSSKSAGWVGKFTGEELANGPLEQVIDYVRVYAYIEASNSFVLDWQDDFEGESLDRSHWSTGNWEMENVMLSRENVVVEDGYCKLLMTREAE